MTRFLLAVLILSATPIKAEEAGFFLLSFSFGPAYAGQALDAHDEYLRELHDRDILLMGGPAANRDIEFVVIRVGSIGQAQTVAQADPLVASGALMVDVYDWRVAMSSMRSSRRSVSPERAVDKPFRVERLDPGAPINIKDRQPDPR